MINRRFFISIVLVLSQCCVFFAQELEQIRFITFSENHRFPSQYVYTATQDETGIMWFGTSSGLYNFDNRFFNHFEPRSQAAGRDINNILQAVYYDKKTNLIWCGSLNNFQWFSPKTKLFSSPTFGKQAISELADNQIKSFFRDSKDRMWICTSLKGWACYDELNQSTDYYFPNKIKEHNLFSKKIIESKGGKLWAITSEGLHEFSKGKENIQSFLNQENNTHNLEDVLYDSHRNCLWLISVGKGLIRFNLNDFSIKIIPLNEYNILGKLINNGYFNSVAFYNDNNLIIDGKLLVDLNTFYVSETSKLTIPNFEFNQLHTENIFPDRENNLWFCTHTGLSLIKNLKFSIKHLNINNPATNHPVEIGKKHLCQGKLYILIDEEPGILLYNQTTSKTETIPTLINEKIDVYDFASISKNALVLSTNKGIFRLNLSDNSLVKIDVEKSLLGKNLKTKITPYSDNEVIFNIEDEGIYIVDMASGRKNKTVCQYSNIIPYIYKIKAFSNGQLFGLTQEGLVHFSSGNYTYRLFKYDTKGQKNKLNSCYDLTFDKDQHIWFTSRSNGLFEAFLDQGQMQILNHNTIKNSGLASKYMSGLCFDEKNLLWIVTLQGLVQYDTKNQRIISITSTASGHVQHAFSRRVDFLSDGRIYTNTYSGIDISESKAQKFTEESSRLIFQNITIGNIEYPFFPSSTIQLSHDRGHFSFDLGNSAYSSGGLNRTFYKLQDFDDWKDLKDNYSLSYSGLPPGNYSLLIKFFDSSGKPRVFEVLKISVQNPFYKKWWFIILSFLFLTAIVVIIYRLKVNAIRKEEKLRSDYSKRIAETEMIALRAQMNPHFMFNALNSIQKFILKNEPQLASNYLTKFSRLIRLILDQSQQSTTSLVNELNLIQLYIDLEKMRFDNAFVFEITLDERINSETLQIPTMLIQPYLENSIWHGILHSSDSGQINLKISITDNETLKIIIEDNGIGRTKAEELKSKSSLSRKSRGMDITRERLANIDSDISEMKIHDRLDSDGNIAGTIVEIILPYKNSIL